MAYRTKIYGHDKQLAYQEETIMIILTLYHIIIISYKTHKNAAEGQKTGLEYAESPGGNLTRFSPKSLKIPNNARTRFALSNNIFIPIIMRKDTKSKVLTCSRTSAFIEKYRSEAAQT